MVRSTVYAPNSRCFFQEAPKRSRLCSYRTPVVRASTHATGWASVLIISESGTKPLKRARLKGGVRDPAAEARDSPARGAIEIPPEYHHREQSYLRDRILGEYLELWGRKIIDRPRDDSSLAPTPAWSGGPEAVCVRPN
jgi:hypothetical protein